MKIESSKQPDYITNIKITLEPSDYSNKFEIELRKLKSKVNMKGFRKGKTPEHLIKKLYGSSVFTESIDKMFNEALRDYIKEKNINHLAQPMFSEGQSTISVDYGDQSKEYALSFDLNEMEPFEIAGIDAQHTYDYFVANVDDAALDAELEILSSQLGKYEEVDDIQPKDHFDAEAVELENGQAKENGYTGTVKIFMDVVFDQELKTQLTTLKKGDKFVTTLSKIENKEKEFMKKNFLKVEESDEREIGDDFEFTISKIERLMPVALTDEVIKERLPELEVETLEEAKTKIKENLQAYYENNSRQLLYYDMMNAIMKATNITVSETFMRRWLAETEKLSPEKIDAEIDIFLRELKWTSIKDKVSKDHGFIVSEDEVQGYLYDRVLGYQRQFGYFDESVTKRLFERIAGDKNEVYNAYNAIKTSKVFKSLEPLINKNEIKVPIEVLNEKVANLNKK